MKVDAAGLCLPSSNYILNSGIPDMPDCEKDRGCSRDGAKILSQAKDGPPVLNRAELSVLGVRELSVIDKLRANSGVRSSLIGRCW